MSVLTKSSYRPARRMVQAREAIQEKERSFWQKESNFYIRLLRQCESLCDKMEAEKYKNLIGQFRHFQDGNFHLLNDGRYKEVRVDFNPLNQSYIRRELEPGDRLDHSSLREHFNTLKEEAFERIGRFFSVRIR